MRVTIVEGLIRTRVQSEARCADTCSIHFDIVINVVATTVLVYAESFTWWKVIIPRYSGDLDVCEA